MTLIGRRSDTISSQALTNSLGTTPVIPFAGMAGGVVLIPASYVSTSIDVYCCDASDGTFLRLYKSDGTAVSLTVAASRAVELPSACFGSRLLKFVTSGNDSARPVTFMLKG
ncbi:MAG: hypothetical protein E6Q97_32800 [Desulfurellales bacterium]|nr:MAG: hypothetical protein E6Q97_32800 [Desulfurellales bacterium]